MHPPGKTMNKQVSILAEVSVDAPALNRCQEIIEKVSAVGFQWENLAGPLAKLEEEIQELRAEFAKVGSPDSITRKSAKEISPALLQRIEEEIGDLIFCVVNISYFFKIKPDRALEEMLARFESRFRLIESAIQDDGKNIKALSLAEMDEYWNKAKERQKNSAQKNKLKSLIGFC